jgi:hypothetical protein
VFLPTFSTSEMLVGSLHSTTDRDIHGARNILIKNCTAKDVDTHPLSDRRKADCSMG